MYAKRKNRLWIRSIITLVLALTISACSSNISKQPVSGNRQSEDNNTPVKISLSYLWTGSDVRAKYYERRLEQFKKEHPEIELHLFATTPANGGADYQKQIQVNLAANSLSDVFLFWSGGRTKFLLDSNSVANLTHFVKNDPQIKDRFFPDSYSGSTRDGKYYGIPMEYSYVIACANRELFKQFNLEYPQTFEDLKKAIHVFKSNGVIPISFSGKSGSEMSFIYDMILQNLLDTDSLIKSVSTRDQDIDPSIEKAAEYMKELNDLGAFPDSAVVMPNEQALELFNSGKAALYITGPDRAGGFSKELVPKVDVIQFPSFPESPSNVQERMISYPGLAYYVNVKTVDPKKVEAAKSLIKYMTDDEYAKMVQEETASLMPNMVKPDTVRMEPLMNQILEMKAQRSDFRGRIGYYLTPAATTEFYNLLAQLMLNQIKPVQFYEELNKKIKEHQN